MRLFVFRRIYVSIILLSVQSGQLFVLSNDVMIYRHTNVIDIILNVLIIIHYRFIRILYELTFV